MAASDTNAKVSQILPETMSPSGRVAPGASHSRGRAHRLALGTPNDLPALCAAPQRMHGRTILADPKSYRILYRPQSRSKVSRAQIWRFSQSANSLQSHPDRCLLISAGQTLNYARVSILWHASGGR